MTWNRYRFYTRAEDYRPLVFNPSYPWWCSGHGDDHEGDFAVIVAYLPDSEPLSTYWDDAYHVDVDVRDSIAFTDRFPCPSYYQPLEEAAK